MQPQQSSTTDRWFGAAGGIAFGALTILGWAFWAAPNFPHTSPGVASWSDSAAAVARYYAAHGTSIRIGCVLGTIALAPLLCFTVALYNRLRAAEGGSGSWAMLALVAGLMVCVVHFIFLTFLFLAALRPGVLGAQATDALVLAGTAGAAASILYATMLFAVGIATVRYDALPRWTGILALIAAPLQFLYIPSIFGAEHIFDVTDGLFGVYATFGTFLPWCIAAGIAMARRPPVQAAEPEPRTRVLAPAGAVR
jgi:hypothetical protein